MNIDVLLSSNRLFRWHQWLIAGLARLEGASVRVRFDGTAPALPASLHMLLSVERLVGGGASERALDALSSSELWPCTSAAAEANLIVDLRGTGCIDRGGPRRLVPLYDGEPAEDALWLALLAPRAPWLSIADTGAKEPLTIGIPGLETAHILAASSETVLSRLIEGLVMAARAIHQGRTPLNTSCGALPPVRAPMGFAKAVTHFSSHRLKCAARKALDELLRQGPRWSVAWRRSRERRAPLTAALNRSDFTELRDDGARYWADPFVIYRDGTHHVFVEEFPFATGKGLISHFTIAPDGTATRPRPVLEQSYHLSYPQVFEHDGAMWMLPESAASGALELYRAEKFPDTWVLEGRIIPEQFGDATLVKHDGRLWLFGSIKAYKSSAWDGLGLYYADRLTGPWTAHPLNPVLIDARAARPAGAMFVQDGALFRPAQDCTRGYGSAINIARVGRLTVDAFEQQTVANVAFAPSQGIMGPHTLNWSNGLEVIDIFARPNSRLTTSGPQAPISL